MPLSLDFAAIFLDRRLQSVEVGNIVAFFVLMELLCL